MNEVADSCAVGGFVVVSEDGDVGSFSYDDFLDDREEVSGSVSDGVVAEDAGVVVSRWIKIAQRNDFPLRVRAGDRAKQHVDHELGFAVGADGDAVEVLSAVVLLAVHRGWGGEDELFAGGEELHHPHQVHGTHDVVLVVFEGDAHRIRRWLQRCEVDDACQGPSLLLAPLKHSLQEGPVQNVPCVLPHVPLWNVTLFR